MYIGIVVGSVVATRKSDDLVGHKLLIVQKMKPNGEKLDSLEVSVDSVGAGKGEHVLVTTGEPAKYVFGSSELSIDSAIVGIIDSMEYSE